MVPEPSASMSPLITARLPSVARPVLTKRPSAMSRPKGRRDAFVVSLASSSPSTTPERSISNPPLMSGTVDAPGSSRSRPSRSSSPHPWIRRLLDTTVGVINSTARGTSVPAGNGLFRPTRHTTRPVSLAPVSKGVVLSRHSSMKCSSGSRRGFGMMSASPLSALSRRYQPSVVATRGEFQPSSCFITAFGCQAGSSCGLPVGPARSSDPTPMP